MAMHIVDRRLNSGGKSLENRQRFLRRAKALIQGAVNKSSQDRDIKDVLEGGEISIPLDGMNEPRFRREGGTRDMVLPGNKKFVEGDMLPRSGEVRGKASGAGEGDEAERTKLMAEAEALKEKIRRIPFIDPVDIRYRRFEPTRKPVAQAVMFCLMDVSGSMSEHMKDLAKRFYMLLYIFLKRRYRHVEIVFIRHTDRAEEVDEETFFRGPASGGTLVSSALQAMHDIVRSRFRPADWNIYAAQASAGDNSISDGEVAGRLLTDMILPVSQFFAYLEVGEAGGYTFDMPDSSLWTLYERLRAGGAPLSMRKVSERSEIFPVFHDLVHRRGKQEKTAP